MKCSDCHANDAQPLLGDLVSCVNCGATGPVELSTEQAPDDPPVEGDVGPVEPVAAVETEV